MTDEEYFATRARLRQALGRLKALQHTESVSGRVRWNIDDAARSVENALKALRGEPTGAAG